MANFKVGVQLYSVRDDFARNPLETLIKVKEAGYDAVEFFGGFTYSAKHLKAMLDTIGLEACGWHTMSEMFSDEKFQLLVAYHQTLGNDYVVIPWLPAKTEDEWKQAGEDLSKYAMKLKPYGMYTGYHNHSEEFTTVFENGKTAWEVFSENISSDVILQFDTGNGMHGGANAVKVLENMTNMGGTVHYKPYSEAKGFDCFIGEDDTDWENVVKLCNTSVATKYAIVEYEEGDAMNGITACYKNLKKFL